MSLSERESEHRQATLIQNQNQEEQHGATFGQTHHGLNTEKVNTVGQQEMTGQQFNKTKSKTKARDEP